MLRHNTAAAAFTPRFFESQCALSVTDSRPESTRDPDRQPRDLFTHLTHVALNVNLMVWIDLALQVIYPSCGRIVVDSETIKFEVDALCVQKET